MMKEVTKDGVVLARHITEEDMNSGLNFFSKENEFIQVGTWWDYENDKDLQSHVHNSFERTTNRTYECLYIIKGSLKAEIFDLEHKKTDEIIAHAGDILVMLESGHGYRILEDNTRVLEVKNGPYFGAEKDRYRF